MRSYFSLGIALTGLWLLLGTPSALAQEADTLYVDPQRGSVATDTSRFGSPLVLGDVVVTATRSLKSLEQVPVPTSVIGREDIRARGTRRLSDLLAEQPGLQLNYDHGAGLQVQGFDADYTLILIDGEPAIGRTAGTLNLERITVADVERVEVVRGPSSSLYGSEALAGVVNVITRNADGPFNAEGHLRYGTHAMTDLAARVSGMRGPLRAKLFMSRYGSGGYDLTPATTTPTVPSFTDYVGRSLLGYRWGDDTLLEVRGRLAHETQTSTVEITQATQRYDNEANRTDWQLAPTFTHALRPGVELELRLVASRYQTRTRLTGLQDGDVLSDARYDQRYYKTETQLQAALGARHLLTAGAGYVREAVDADRVTGARSGGFVFVQDEWSPTAWLEVVPSARLDAHSDYATRLSPKVATLVRPTDRVRLRASIGSGYKAPAFRQLYLNFTNPQAGYSVFGAEEVLSGLDQLDAQGQLATLLANPVSLGGAILAERSVAVNVGGEVDLAYDVGLRVNAFHNEVRDLIDTQPIARKTNGQQVFTYFNRGRVFTRGLEAELTWQPLRTVDVALSYTYLEAKDRDVLDDLEAGRVYRRTDAGRDVAVSPADYAGLRGRSPHRATARLTLREAPLGLTASFRARYRSRYGFADLNGNAIIDANAEYAPGFAVLDLTLTRSLLADVALQVGVENLTDHADPQYVPHLSGRTWFVGLQAQFQ
jgi:outer membrane receptor for ferrienterochelin and colicins